MDSTTGNYIALCPTHCRRLEVWTKSWGAMQQETNAVPQLYLICPEDNVRFPLFGNTFSDMVRRYGNYQEAISLKGAKIYDLDNVYTPVLKVAPKPKDNRFSIQVEIDTTPQGKKMVIYAADRQQDGKSQIFIDPPTDKVSFDSNDIHPNMIFSKVEATFKNNKSSVLEDKS